ncbi:MAG: hypothetical protein L3J39_11760 [Verrucomicrobiales bacterium]|nr:hypothetical protein [Verrucomicrobiales bacterium]
MLGAKYAGWAARCGEGGVPVREVTIFADAGKVEIAPPAEGEWKGRLTAEPLRSIYLQNTGHDRA